MKRKQRKQRKKKTRVRKSLDIQKLKFQHLSGREYREHLISLLEQAEKFPPITTIDQAIAEQSYLFKVAKELYRFDNE